MSKKVGQWHISRLFSIAFLLLLALLASSCGGGSTSGSPSTNPPDPTTPSTTTPISAASWERAGNAAVAYASGIDPENYENQPSAYLKSIVDDICQASQQPTAGTVCNGFGTLTQSVAVDRYLGKRIRFSAFVKSEGVDQWAGLWMRVDRAGTPVPFDNMQNRPIKGTSAWQNYQVVLDVPPDATRIVFGTLLTGHGKVWLSGAKLEIVGSDVPVTSLQPTTPGSTDGAATLASWTAYVKAQARPLQSIDPAQSDYSDLAFLSPLLQSRTIVELGESGHGVAEFSQAKIRLIKYLHEKLGYDVMAFESSILSTYRSNERAGELDARAFMQNSVFAVWNTSDVEKLFAYIKATQATEHPLILAGFDVQLTTADEGAARPGIFQEVVSQVNAVYGNQVRDMDKAFVQVVQYSSQSDVNTYILNNYSRLKADYLALTEFLDNNMERIKAAYPTRPLYPLVVRQAAWGMGAYLDELYELAQNAQTSNARDAGMATNLEQLVDKLYPGKKVIVWAHNAHLMHDASAISNYGPWTNMGKLLHANYGSSAYTLALMMYQGSAAQNNRVTYTIKPAPASMVEGLLHTTGQQYVFLDLSQATQEPGSSWMFAPFTTRDWGTNSITLVPRDQYDGVLLIDTVHPPTYVQ